MRVFVFIFFGHAFLPSFLRTPSKKYYDFETKDTVQRFCDAGVELGLPAGDDYNGDTQEGAFFSQTTTKDGSRHDTASAFLFQQDAMARSNLTVMTETHVTRVLFQGDTATGVLCRKGTADLKKLQGIPDVFISAKREVILSAGAVNTPWLLMLRFARKFSQPQPNAKFHSINAAHFI
jgi:choline dehydrogenase-like flavoprotein